MRRFIKRGWFVGQTLAAHIVLVEALVIPAEAISVISGIANDYNHISLELDYPAQVPSPSASTAVGSVTGFRWRCRFKLDCVPHADFPRNGALQGLAPILCTAARSRVDMPSPQFWELTHAGALTQVPNSLARVHLLASVAVQIVVGLRPTEKEHLRPIAHDLFLSHHRCVTL